jgi:exodeoxyribonuclease VII small subunit
MTNIEVSSLDETNLTFEQAYIELETIINALEAEEHSLEDALALYERGQLLTRYCAKMLNEAELRIQQLSGENLNDFTQQYS